ncbi:hypothetical protein EPO15_07250 [bacterium]|nr:MAG: hypothetical protein EPO15_07250 [bacterium]
MNPAALGAALALALPTSLPPSAPADSVGAVLRDSSERAALAEVLDGRLVLAADAKEDEAVFYKEALRTLLKTPTGRSLAEAFADLPGGPVTVRFESLERIGGKAVAEDGKDAVVLGRTLLSWKPEWAAQQGAGLLAHELLGHMLSSRRARAAGVGWEHAACLEDEVDAGLVGTLVTLEAGWRFLDPGAESLLKDRPAYEAELQWRQPEYAVALRDAELADPRGALRARLAQVEGRFDTPQTRELFGRALRERLDFLESRPDVRQSLADYAAHPFHREMEAAIVLRLARLRTLAPPPPEDQSPLSGDAEAALAPH